MRGEKIKIQSFVLRLTFISPPHPEHSEAKLSHSLRRLFELSLSPRSCGGAPVKTATPVFSVLTSACQMFGLLLARSRLAISLKNTRTSKQTAAPATLLSSPLVASRLLTTLAPPSGHFLADHALGFSISGRQTLALGNVLPAPWRVFV